MSGHARLVALAALFAPERAAALLGRLAGPDGSRAAARAALLSAAPRRERLHALAAALGGRGDRRARAAAAAGVERPRVAAMLRRVGEDPSTGAERSPLLGRLCRERVEP